MNNHVSGFRSFRAKQLHKATAFEKIDTTCVLLYSTVYQVGPTPRSRCPHSARIRLARRSARKSVTLGLTTVANPGILTDMNSNPRGDNDFNTLDPTEEVAWAQVLEHRVRDSASTFAAVVERFRAAGVTPQEVQSHLQDGGDRMYQAAASGKRDWALQFGGEQAVALLAAEVSALMSHLVARAAMVRSMCVEALLDEFSAVSVAGALGVARQKIYQIGRANTAPDFVEHTPWRKA